MGPTVTLSKMGRCFVSLIGCSSLVVAQTKFIVCPLVVPSVLRLVAFIQLDLVSSRKRIRLAGQACDKQ